MNTTDEKLDGIALHVGNVGSYKDDVNNTFYFESDDYNLGRTLTHEVGHYFNLDHIWGTSAQGSCLLTGVYLFIFIYFYLFCIVIMNIILFFLF